MRSQCILWQFARRIKSRLKGLINRCKLPATWIGQPRSPISLALVEAVAAKVGVVCRKVSSFAWNILLFGVPHIGCIIIPRQPLNASNTYTITRADKIFCIFSSAIFFPSTGEQLKPYCPVTWIEVDDTVV